MYVYKIYQLYICKYTQFMYIHIEKTKKIHAYKRIQTLYMYILKY
jgi:hypothetical protein